MRIYYLFILSFIISFSSISQQRCSTDEYIEILNNKYPQYKELRKKVNSETKNWIQSNYNKNSKSIITIPVVVHVVWNTSAENISDQQIFSQIDVLNADYRRTNVDAIMTPSVWQGIAADTEIEFCLATSDPNGVFTNASNSMLVTEQAVKRYVDRQADLYFSLDTTGLNQTASAGTSGSVAELLGTLAPVANFRPLTKAYVASVVQNPNTIATTTVSVTVSISSTSAVLTGVTPSIANPTRNNDLIYRVNSGGTSWEYVSG